MARRKNTADCRDVLGKIFEAEAAGRQGGRTVSGENLGSSAQPGSAGDAHSSAEGQAKPLLGRPLGESSVDLNRDGGIRSSAPGLAGSESSPAPASHEEPAGAEAQELPSIETIEARDPESSDQLNPGGDADGFADGDPTFGDEPGPGQLGFDGVDDGVSGDETDPLASRMSGDLSFEEDPVAADPVDQLTDDIISQARSDGPVPQERKARPGLLGWLLRDDSMGVLGQSLQVRASTLVMIALTTAIVVGLLGLYFNIDRTEGNLAGRILDEREQLAGANTSSGEARSHPVESGTRVSSNLPVRRAGAGGIPLPARPVWSRGGGSRPPVAQRPPVRNVQGAGAPPVVTTSATRWLRVRDLMGKEECAKLLDHLKRLQRHLEERSGCVDGSIACKELKSRIKERNGEELYAVDIGPFASWNFAQAASANLKEVTRSAPWVFRDKVNYFAESYPRKP